MFNKIKKFAKKAAKKIKEVVKHIVEKVEEDIMAKEEIGLKKMEFVNNTVSELGHKIYEHPVVFIGSTVGLALGTATVGVVVGAAIIIEKKHN